MQNNVVQLDLVNHVNLKVINQLDLKFAEQGTMVPVIMHEMAQVSTELPIVFVKHPETGEFACMAILGLKAKQNLMINDGQWRGTYVPVMLSFAPLGLVDDPDDSSKVMIVINMDSDFVSETQGEPLFDFQGQSSAFLNERVNSMLEFRRSSDATRDFIKTLVELDLLQAQDFTYQQSAQDKSVRGIYMISKEKVNQLSIEALTRLHQSDYLAAIYHCLASRYNFNKLVALAE